jgi:ADP-heptose:LPS heptosyltransferase
LKQKKAIVFFSAGLGDAVLLIPMLKWLKTQGYHLSGFFNSKHPCEEIFSDTGLLDKILVRKGKTKHILFSTTHFLKYDLAIVNYFAASRKNLVTAGLVAKKVLTNREVISASTNLFKAKTTFISPKENIHDAQQNLFLAGAKHDISLGDFDIEFKSAEDKTLPHSFIAVQISAGNNKVQYKNWPVKYWVEFLQMIQKNYPAKKIVLVGDENESGLGQQITLALKENVISLIGKTTVKEVMNILAQSDFFIGLDGGLMHLAVALKKPTFTIWGPSSENLYGYEKLDPQLHKCVHLNLSCRPCSAWINANHSKAMNPDVCPDHACIQQLLPLEVFNQLTQYVNLLPVNAG